MWCRSHLGAGCNYRPLKKRWAVPYCLGRRREKKEWGREVRGYSVKEEVEEEAAAGGRSSEQRQRCVQQISPKQLKSFLLNVHCRAVSSTEAGVAAVWSGRRAVIRLGS